MKLRGHGFSCELCAMHSCQLVNTLLPHTVCTGCGGCKRSCMFTCFPCGVYIYVLCNQAGSKVLLAQLCLTAWPQTEMKAGSIHAGQAISRGSKVAQAAKSKQQGFVNIVLFQESNVMKLSPRSWSLEINMRVYNQLRRREAY